MLRRSLIARVGLAAAVAPLAPAALLTRASSAWTPAAQTLQGALAQMARVGYTVKPMTPADTSPNGWYGWVYNETGAYIGLVANDGALFTQVSGWNVR